MGYVFEETPNPIIDGVVHLAWKEVSGAYPRKINLVCSGKWVPSKTKRSSRRPNCLGCVAELMCWEEDHVVDV